MRGQRPGRIVFYRRKVKSRGCKRGCGSIAIAAFQYFGDPGGGLPAAADLDQRADDVSHHVLQEGIGGKFEANQVAAAADLELAQHLDRRFRLAFGGAKCAEIMFADQALRGLLHRAFIKSPVIPAYATAKEPRALRTVKQPVHVAPAGCGKTRMKLRVHHARPVHGDSIGQQRVAAPDPCAGRALHVNVEVHHLCKRVHSGVGAPGAHRIDAPVGHPRKRALKRILYRAALRLGLPAAESCAVVFESESYSQSAGSKAVAGRSRKRCESFDGGIAQQGAAAANRCGGTDGCSGIQAGEHGLRGGFLFGVAFLKHFLEDFARTVLVAHFLVGLGKVELGLNVIPTIILARG